MKQHHEIKCVTLPNNGGTVVLIPEGMDNKMLKFILNKQKNNIILIGNRVGRTIFEDYKKKAKILQRLLEPKVEVYN